jgi:hypothetical protein
MLSKTQIKRDMIPYTLDIRSITYAMLYTKPAVSYALSITSKYQSNLGEKSLKDGYKYS